MKRYTRYSSPCSPFLKLVAGLLFGLLVEILLFNFFFKCMYFPVCILVSVMLSVV